MLLAVVVVAAITALYNLDIDDDKYRQCAYTSQHLPSMLGLNKPEGEPGAALPSILVGLFAAFAGILYGM